MHAEGLENNKELVGKRFKPFTGTEDHRIWDEFDTVKKRLSQIMPILHAIGYIDKPQRQNGVYIK